VTGQNIATSANDLKLGLAAHVARLGQNIATSANDLKLGLAAHVA